MAQSVNIGMPMRLDIGPGYTLRVTAISPTTGAVVAGVNIGETVLEVEGTGDLSNSGFEVGSPLLITVQA